MSFFVSSHKARYKPGSHFALALALATGSALVATAVAEPAQAMQRKKDKKKKKDEERPQYSREFIEAYAPIDDAMKAEGTDLATVKGMVPAMKALAVSPDEQFAAGNIIYNIGAMSQDQSFQLDGMKMMLGSGKVAPEQIGQFNFVAYQLLTVAGQHAQARVHLQNAMDANYSSENMTADQLRVNMAESFFSENRFTEGLDYLAAGISQRKAAGRQVDEQWYRRGLTVAYNNEITPQVYDFVAEWVVDYPEASNWRDAINITRNLNNYEAAEMLDLMRLSFTAGALSQKTEYIDYIEAADPRRLPKEVQKVIEHGYMTGQISRDDIFIADSLRTANGRIESDLADLPALESDAKAPGASLRTVVAAADTFLNYDEPEKAELFYTKAMGMAGADKPMVLTRLGISQVHQGKFDEAIANFKKVEGPRYAIARLWTAFATDAKPALAPAPADAGTEPVTTAAS